MSDSEKEKPKKKEEDPTPYGTEYSLSNRAGCRQCKEKIAKDTLRMSVRFPSYKFDGYQVHWFHFDCFWTDRRSQHVEEAKILGFENIRQEDKDRILQKIAEAHAGSSAVGDGKPIVEQIKVEVAKSSTGKCQICKKGIESRDLRIQTKAHFFHVGCFHTEKNAKGRIAKDFAGFEKLDDDQKTTILSLFPEQGSTRKRKTGTADADAIHSKKEIKTEDHSEAPTQTKKQKKMKAIKEEGPETDNDKKKDQENDANKSDKQTSSSKEANKTGKEEGRAKAAGGKKQLAKRMI